MQKFNKGDLVQIDDDLGPSMSHFESGCEAIVIGSYKDKFGGDNDSIYTLNLKGRGKVSWYYEKQLTLIDDNRLDLLDEWEKEREKEINKCSDIDWIFKNGESVIKEPKGASIARLAKELGIENLWGKSGEGYVWYSNAMATLEVAKPFLRDGDKKGFLKHCTDIRAN